MTHGKIFSPATSRRILAHPRFRSPTKSALPLVVEGIESAEGCRACCKVCCRAVERGAPIRGFVTLHSV